MSAMPSKPRAGTDPLVANYREFGDVLARLNRLPLAVISVIEGPAVGGGLGMACCSDVVILHRSAKVGVPEPRSGFIPSQILPFMVRRIGEGPARYLAVTGAIVDAPAALGLGLGHFLCRSTGALERRLGAVLRDIGRMEPDALATAKRLVLMCASQSDAEVMDQASLELVRLLRRPEARAGMRAFLLKKPPPWARD
jgi:isohexenylglutaconyl-CoA hydratase